jgi:hypothetical protein
VWHLACEYITVYITWGSRASCIVVLEIRILLQHALRQSLSDIFLLDGVAEVGEFFLATGEEAGLPTQPRVETQG